MKIGLRKTSLTSSPGANRVESSLLLLGTGIILGYSTILWSRILPRIKHLQAGKLLPEPYMDPVTYLIDAVPLVRVPRPVAEQAVHRLLRSQLFKRQTSGLDPRIQRSFIERLRAKMRGMPRRLSDTETKELERYIQLKQFG